MDSKTNDLIARQYMSEKIYSSVESREFADWAVRMLETGHDGQSLRILASQFEARAFSDVDSYFRASIAELGWEFPDKTTATRQYSESIMQRMVDGQVQPYDGCRALHSVCMYLDYPADLYNWQGLFWAEDDLSDEELDSLIKDEARRTLAGETAERIHEGFMMRKESAQSTGFWMRLKKLIK